VVWDRRPRRGANVLTVLRATRAAKCPLRIISFDCTLEPLRFDWSTRDALVISDMKVRSKFFCAIIKPPLRMANRQVTGNFNSEIFRHCWKNFVKPRSFFPRRSHFI